MQIWSTEIKELVMLYSRRCLEVIITDLCDHELKRPRKTEPLKGIIDKLNREEKVPSHIITSMDNLNSLSTYGTHPKDFDPEQVKPVLNNLAIIIKWYLKYKDAQTIGEERAEEIKQDIKEQDNSKETIRIPKKRLIMYAGLFLAVVIVVAGLFALNIIGGGKQTENNEKSVAVLPFVNLSNDPEQEYFSDGMVDEILDHLFKIGDLKVISRTSSMRYKDTKLTLKEIARELGVSAILEGSVRKIGNNVRITAQLIDTKTDTHLWSETYEGDLSDVFSIQSQVAQNVARELKATLTSKETGLIQNAPLTTNQLAYDFYLKGNDYLSKRKNSLAIDMYSKAILEDSLFTAAYARRSQAYILIYWFKYEGWQGHDLKAREDIKKGLQLNPESREIRFAEAVAYYQIDRNYDKSLKILTELKAVAPNMADLYAYSSHVLRRQGKLEESINEIKKGIQLDPFNADYFHNLIQTLQLLHQYDKLIEFINKEFTIVTDQWFYEPKTYKLALIHYLSGNTSLGKIYADSAITHLKEKINENPIDERFYTTLGKCYAFSGNDKEAIACGKKAVDLKPVKLDAWQSVIKEQDLMEIYMTNFAGYHSFRKSLNL
jgi:TolB-like protein